MREFSCKSLGNGCMWTQNARTEELLADIVAVHLRDVHGISVLGPDMLGKIKNSFSNPSPIDPEEPGDPVMKEYNCDLSAKCGWHTVALTEELIADNVAVHAREAHGIKEFTPEMKTKVENALHVWKG
ncbi:MAG TPA: DUF1059 domain-containing protein [Nitrospirota bacterium]|nr:DUF1059 domain-containing protein [Nitrospirota bacterium]